MGTLGLSRCATVMTSVHGLGLSTAIQLLCMASVKQTDSVGWLRLGGHNTAKFDSGDTDGRRLAPDKSVAINSRAKPGLGCRPKCNWRLTLWGYVTEL